MRRDPFVYELNTWVWLGELSEREGRPVGLGDVPPRDWDAIAALGFDTVWLMGVWERSPAGIAIALENEGLVESFREALPDYRPEDVVGSPYCIRGYSVDPHLGGPDGLAAARAALAERGLGLILDFVPNHVAPDHPWVAEHPEYFVRGNEEDLARDPSSFVRTAGGILANGRDPYFPAWPDVVQLNAFSPELRTAVVETLRAIAAQCDGVRCDMAMLVMSDVFERTWAERVGPRPAEEYWPTVIAAVRESHPGFLFLAEAYWDLEWALQQQGFDACYDKRLYDRLAHDGAEEVRGHLTADPAYQRRLVRFLENHDEPRAAAAFPPEQARVAAVTTLTQAGPRLVHEGQLEGRRVRLPVFLARQAGRAGRRGSARVLRPPSAGGRRRDVPRRRVAARGAHRLARQRLLAQPRGLGLAGRRAARPRRREPRWRRGNRACLAPVGRPARALVGACRPDDGRPLRAERRRAARRSLRRARAVAVAPLPADAQG